VCSINRGRAEPCHPPARRGVARLTLTCSRVVQHVVYDDAGQEAGAQRRLQCLRSGDGDAALTGGEQRRGVDRLGQVDDLPVCKIFAGQRLEAFLERLPRAAELAEPAAGRLRSLSRRASVRVEVFTPMRFGLAFVLLMLAGSALLAQAALQPEKTTPPTSREVRTTMGIPSTDDVRGQQDAVGFASKAEQMARVWELSATPPAPDKLGDAPPPGVAGVICAHDDYIYAGRVYRQVLPLVTAKTVILVGVFHKYRRFGAHDVLVFDSYRAWRSPDGDVPVSPVREEILGHLPKGDFARDNTAHDSEHSLEALVFWLRHERADLRIVPIIIPAMGFPRMQELAGHLATALADVMTSHNWRFGRDVAVVISSDAVHYGADFNYTPYGEGGVEAYVKACDKDRSLLTGPLAGAVTSQKVEQFFSTCVNPEEPSQYRLTWCGRFAIPLGMLLLERTTAALGLPTPVGHPIAYGTSISSPELSVKDIGLGETAQSNLYHFVGYPAVAYTIGE
jgi:AmmeMemoRadiSam system protein B